MYYFDDKLYNPKKEIPPINFYMDDFKIFNVIYQYVSPNGIEHAGENSWTWHMQPCGNDKFSIVFTNLEDYASISFFSDGKCHLHNKDRYKIASLDHTQEENEKAVKEGYINAAMKEFIEHQQQLEFKHILK